MSIPGQPTISVLKQEWCDLCKKSQADDKTIQQQSDRIKLLHKTAIELAKALGRSDTLLVECNSRLEPSIENADLIMSINEAVAENETAFAKEG